jgi:hypothetical protein
MDYVMTFGIGDKKIDSLQVIWPNGKFQTIKKVTNNTTLTLNIGDAKFNYTIKKIVSKPLFIEKNLIFSS